MVRSRSEHRVSLVPLELSQTPRAPITPLQFCIFFPTHTLKPRGKTNLPAHANVGTHTQIRDFIHGGTGAYGGANGGALGWTVPGAAGDCGDEAGRGIGAEENGSSVGPLNAVVIWVQRALILSPSPSPSTSTSASATERERGREGGRGERGGRAGERKGGWEREFFTLANTPFIHKLKDDIYFI